MSRNNVCCLDEENHIHELSTEVNHLQNAVQKQREEMRTLEHDISEKNAELEVVSFIVFQFYVSK